MTSRLLTISLLILLLGLSKASAFESAEPSQSLTFAEVRTFMDGYCLRCHGEKVQKGGLNLSTFTDEKKLLKSRKIWRGVAEQITSGDMPPEGEKQPTQEERDRLVKWITTTLAAAEERDRQHPDPGRPVIRRLTPGEYNRTVRDLLGVEMDVAGAVGMPDDTVSESFDNLAAALNISDTLTEKYFAAADLILERLYAPPPNKKLKPGELPPLLAKVIKPNDAKRTIAALLRRAYRRPIESREIDRFVALFEKATREGAKFEEALRPVIKGMLVSPNFLLRVEHDHPKEEKAYRVNSHELATRLSYFLWSSMPDVELDVLADQGELSKPEVYEAQVKRMLADPKAKALTDTFAEQWLQLKKLAQARPSTEFFPTFNSKMRQAMGEEVRTFFDKLRSDDLAITDLLDGNYTYVNGDLAKHYGMSNIAGPEFRKVKLADANRGGLLGMGAVLAMTSHTNRTSPTLRGKYVLDVILGTPPPPPPPGVSQIDEGKSSKELKTFRDKLAAHARQANCAGCHAKIDPLGVGLENFDAVGRWRSSSKEIDATGKLPTGEAFNGPKELRSILLQKKERFVENVVEKMMVFALGRELQAADAVAVKAIAADLQKKGYRFSVLMQGVAQSFPFQHRRNPKEED